jgi:hypothetical protein
MQLSLVLSLSTYTHWSKLIGFLHGYLPLMLHLLMTGFTKPKRADVMTPLPNL